MFRLLQLLASCVLLLAPVACSEAPAGPAPPVETEWEEFYFEGRELSMLSAVDSATRTLLMERLPQIAYEGEIYRGIASDVDFTDLRDMRVQSYRSDPSGFRGVLGAPLAAGSSGQLRAGSSQSQLTVSVRFSEDELELSMIGTFETLSAQHIIDEMSLNTYYGDAQSSPDSFTVAWHISGTRDGQHFETDAVQQLGVLRVRYAAELD